jgi:hypothetical protein
MARQEESKSTHILAYNRSDRTTREISSDRDKYQNPRIGPGANYLVLESFSSGSAASEVSGTTDILVVGIAPKNVSPLSKDETLVPLIVVAGLGCISLLYVRSKLSSPKLRR